MKDNLIYLACPYTHDRKWIMDVRWQLITSIGAELITRGYHIFGPITESVCYQHANPLVGHSWDFWQTHDLKMIDSCTELWVIKLPGWKTSTGVRAEIKYARSLKKKVRYIKPSTILKDWNEAFITN